MATFNIKKVSAGIAIIVIICIFPLSFSNAQTQTNIAFNPADQFSIPAYNGSISFAVNGTYSQATFENNTWTFTNLLMNSSQPLENFVISTQNSKITIVSYVTADNNAIPSARLRYVVEGQGKQILNLGIGLEESGSNPIIDWYVVVNGKILGEGEGWSISHDGTVTINGLSGNVSVVYDNFTGAASNSNLPFYQQHLVAIAIAVAVAVVVVIAVVIKVRNREQPSEK